MLSTKDVERLARQVKDGEIKEVVFQLGPFEAPGIDGFSELSFQCNWNTVGPLVYNEVRQIFQGGSIDVEICSTLLVLIPKVEKPETFAEF